MVANPAALAGLLALAASALYGWQLCRLIDSCEMRPVELPFSGQALACGVIACGALGVLLLLHGCLQAGWIQ